jgi:hypothetical protein
MSAPLRLCKDCKHFHPAHAGPPMCVHPSSVFVHPVDVITGNTPPPSPMTCSQARLLPADRDGYCGREGLHWEPAEIGFGDP